MNYLGLIARTEPIFCQDLNNREAELREIVSKNRFLVIGGAGSIGQAVTREIFRRHPLALHVVDISENNMVELVRDLRSTLGYIDGDFQTFAIDCGSREFQVLMSGTYRYDYILNLSALKHVRSEKDPYTLHRLIEVNILNTITTIQLAREQNVKKYFCVSTDKAANPVNMMGASKRIMEMFLMRESVSTQISTARFANVAFSDGSLLHGFNQRFAKHQPIAAPNDVKRYFLTPQESGELCLMSTVFGKNRDIFFPKLSEQLHLITFSEIAERYIRKQGYEPYHCSSEEEARNLSDELITSNRWPCYFFKSDTSGEKDFEEFFTENEKLNMETFQSIGIIKNEVNFSSDMLDNFLERIHDLRAQKVWQKKPVIDLFNEIIPNFHHKETGKYLDGRM